MWTDSPPGLADLSSLRDDVGRRAALDRLGAFELIGEVRMVHAGVVGSVKWRVEDTDRYSRTSDFGLFGLERTIVDGETGWVESPGAPKTELHGVRLREAIRSHPAALFGPWGDHFASVTVLRTERIENRDEYVVELGGGGDAARIVYVDGETGDVLRVESTVLDATSSISVPVRTSYEDYRDVGGVRIPFRIIDSTEITGDSVTQLDELRSIGSQPRFPVGG